MRAASAASRSAAAAPRPPAETRLFATDLACLRGGRIVFAGISFALDPGGALLLTGPNGSGKSSLLRLLAGLVPSFTGRVDWPGTIAYLGHQDAVKPALTARETLAFWAVLADPRDAAERAALALDAADLSALADLPGRYLSAGQKRRLALARLDAGPATLWLLDEPTLGLDAAAVSRLEAAIARHRATGGLVVLATHAPIALPAATTLALDAYAAEPA